MNVKASPFLFKGGAYRGPKRYFSSDPEPIGPGCMDQINQNIALAKGYSDNSTEIEDSPCPAQLTLNRTHVSGTSRCNNDHFEVTDSVCSLDDIQDGKIFDYKTSMLDAFATKSDVMQLEMQQETILWN